MHISNLGKSWNFEVMWIVFFFFFQAILKLLPRCLAAAYTVLGVHPFPRLDVLIVPAGFSSLGMAR